MDTLVVSRRDLGVFDRKKPGIRGTMMSHRQGVPAVGWLVGFKSWKVVGLGYSQPTLPP